jgi:cytochrome c5
MPDRTDSLLLRAAALSLFALLAGCKQEPRTDQPDKSRSAAPAPPPGPTTPSKAAQPAAWVPGNAEHGKKLVEQFECSRCHEGTGVAPVSKDKHCIHCHQDILAGKFKAPAAVVAKWKPNVEKFRDVPSLNAIGGRLVPEAIERYLLEPKDLRPNLVQNMPRLKLTPEQARDIVTHLVKDEFGKARPPAEPEGDSTTGRELFEAKGCGTCHTFSGVPPLATQPKPDEGNEEQRRAVTLAPDLRYARERLRAERIVQWISDPKSIKADTLMTPSPLTPPEARHIAAYVLTASLEAPAPKPLPPRLPVLTRKVSFEEVNTKVLMRTCRHCHGDADSQLGDGGPGNTGGFGFKPRGLNLSHHRGALSGLIDDHGERQSAFQPLKNGTPRIIGALLARHAEESGKPDSEVRGMPLGLPPLPAEDIQLFESWVAQGRAP